MIFIKGVLVTTKNIWDRDEIEVKWLDLDNTLVNFIQVKICIFLENFMDLF